MTDDQDPQPNVLRGSQPADAGDEPEAGGEEVDDLDEIELEAAAEGAEDDVDRKSVV